MAVGNGQGSPDIYSGERGQKYFDQRAAARSAESQRRRATFFKGLGNPAATILDFGCGNGGVLAALPARKRIGVEVNPQAFEEATGKLDRVVTSLREVDDDSIDTAISFHALEHVPNPYFELQELRRVMKPGAPFSFIVPYEFTSRRRAFGPWSAGDIDMHLYGWTPLTFGNLCTLAGLTVSGCTLGPMSTSERFGAWAGSRLSWLKGIKAGRLQVCAHGHG